MLKKFSTNKGIIEIETNTNNIRVECKNNVVRIISTENSSLKPNVCNSNIKKTEDTISFSNSTTAVNNFTDNDEYFCDNSDIISEIIGETVFDNNYSFRRWITAQYMYIVENEKSVYSYLNKCSMTYVIKTLLDEAKVLAKLEKEDKESFAIRKMCFTHDVYKNAAYSIYNDVIRYIHSQIKYTNLACKRKPYLRLPKPFGNVYLADITSKILNLRSVVDKICEAENYEVLHEEFSKFAKMVPNLDNKKLISNKKVVNAERERLANDILYFAVYPRIYKVSYKNDEKVFRIPKLWKDAFQKAGAYYSLENLILSHGLVLCVKDEEGEINELKGKEAMNLLNIYLNNGMEGYVFHAILMLTIDENHYDFFYEIKKD